MEAEARSINNAMQYVERELSGRSDVQVLHATGEVNYEYYMAEMRKAGSLDDNIMISHICIICRLLWQLPIWLCFGPELSVWQS
ncbi:MAG: hypothetical protein ACLRXQ_11505 [Phascolarctobacterium faecium]